MLDESVLEQPIPPAPPVSLADEFLLALSHIV